jgi:succinate dehydrogenase/fumarate reductase flavoprotein subunit
MLAISKFDVDVLVVGGGVAGVSAAVTAALWWSQNVTVGKPDFTWRSRDKRVHNGSRGHDRRKLQRMVEQT